MARVEVFDDPAALLDAAADAVTAIALASVAARGRVTLALAGGSTPRGLYQRLAGGWRERLDWTRVHVFWGDERCVPPTHADSNYRMAREALLDHVPIPTAQIHRMAGEADPEAAALDYAATLGGDARRRVDAIAQVRSIWCCSAWAPTATPPRSFRIARQAGRPGAWWWRTTWTPPAAGASRSPRRS